MITSPQEMTSDARSNPQRLPRLAAALLALAGAGAPAAAALVQIEFSVTIDTTTSSLSGQVVHGSLAYDDAPGTPGTGLETWFSLSQFSFQFSGADFELGDLAFGDAVHDAGLFVGLEAVEGGGLFAFVPGLSGQPASFSFDLGGGDAGYGSISYRQLPPGTVDEPATLWLLGLPLVGLALTRRRRPQRQ